MAVRGSAGVGLAMGVHRVHPDVDGGHGVGVLFRGGRCGPAARPRPGSAPGPDTSGPADRAAGYAEGYAQAYPLGLRDGQAAEADRTFASWSPGGPFDLPPDVSTWGVDLWAGVASVPVMGGEWRQVPVPLAAVWAAQVPAAWGASAWTAAVWRG